MAEAEAHLPRRGIGDALAGKSPLAEVEKLLPLWEDAIVITQEVGCGLVPIAPEDRIWREAVGRVNCRLAEYAETVERVCCGLGMTLKGAH